MKAYWSSGVPVVSDQLVLPPACAPPQRSQGSQEPSRVLCCSHSQLQLEEEHSGTSPLHVKTLH